MRLIYAWNTATDETERAEGIKAIGGMPPRLDGALDILSKAFPGLWLADTQREDRPPVPRILQSCGPNIAELAFGRP
jgi:hypothetical protein